MNHRSNRPSLFQPISIPPPCCRPPHTTRSVCSPAMNCLDNSIPLSTPDLSGFPTRGPTKTASTSAAKCWSSCTSQGGRRWPHASTSWWRRGWQGDYADGAGVDIDLGEGRRGKPLPVPLLEVARPLPGRDAHVLVELEAEALQRGRRFLLRPRDDRGHLRAPLRRRRTARRGEHCCIDQPCRSRRCSCSARSS